MDTSIIKEAGLTENEAKVYLALIELGTSTVGKISEKSRIHRTNVYDSLNSLEKKELVKCTDKGQTRHYEAADPENLTRIIKSKKERLKRILPELKLSMQLAPKKSQVHVYEGLEAFKSMLNHFLDTGKERFVIGAPASAYPRINDFLEIYHQRRVNLKIPMKQIYNYNARERAKHLNTIPYTEARCLPKEYDSPVSTTFCGDEVLITYWGEVPIFIHIISKEIVEVYKGYFMLLWSKAKKPSEIK